MYDCSFLFVLQTSLTLPQCMEQITVFVNAHQMASPQNKVAVIGSHANERYPFSDAPIGGSKGTRCGVIKLSFSIKPSLINILRYSSNSR